MTAAAHSAPATSLPALEEVLPLARALARKFAYRDSDIDDLVQHALMKYHHELENKKHTEVRNCWSFVRTILSRAMNTYYYYSYPSKNKSYKLNTLEFQRYQNAEAMVAGPKCPEELWDAQRENNLFDQFDLDDYFRELEKECGRTARILAENLVSPNDPCIASYILAKSNEKVAARQEAEQAFRAQEARLIDAQADAEFDAATVGKKTRKYQEHVQRARMLEQDLQQLRAQRKCNALPRGGGKQRSIRVTQSVICEAMGLAPHQRQRQIDSIKQFTRSWLQRNGSVRAESRN